MTALRIEQVSAGYGALEVVAGVDLVVASGEVVALLGRNGAGKTTTLLAISGALRRRSGRVLLGEHELGSRSAARVAASGLAMVPAGHRIFPEMTVEENLRVGAFTRRRARRQWRSDLDEIHEMFPVLAQKGHLHGGELSGGEQQMLAIGQALLARPQFLLLDEPSFGLAPAVVGTIYTAVRRLAGDGMGVLVVEQEVDRALRSADRIYVMEGGRIVRDAPAHELDASDVFSVMVGDA